MLYELKRMQKNPTKIGMFKAKKKKVGKMVRFKQPVESRMSSLAIVLLPFPSSDIIELKSVKTIKR